MTDVMNIGDLGTETDFSTRSTVRKHRELLEQVASNSISRVFTLGNIRANAGYIEQETPDGWKQRYPLDINAVRAIGAPLLIPVPYLSRVAERNAELTTAIVNFGLRQYPDAELEFISDSDGYLKEVKHVDALSIDALDGIRAIEAAIGGDALVERIYYGLNDTVIDIIDPTIEAVPAHRLGDATIGGLRVTLSRKSTAPVVGMYLQRLVCTNGMTATSSADLFNIKGMTRDDVIENLENSVRNVYQRLPEYLAAYTSLTEKVIENPVRIAQVYGHENGISLIHIERAVEIITGFDVLHDGYEWTLYDIIQVYTGLANDEKVKEGAKRKLQGLAGNVIVAMANEHRCDKCYHIVD